MVLNLAVDSLEKPVFTLALLQNAIKGREMENKESKE